jgi:hypothetical protein
MEEVKGSIPFSSTEKKPGFVGLGFLRRTPSSSIGEGETMWAGNPWMDPPLPSASHVAASFVQRDAGGSSSTAMALISMR